MISFNCEKCGKLFRVPDEYAGRSAKCKICGNMVKVPVLAVAVAKPGESATPVEGRVSTEVERVSRLADPKPTTRHPASGNGNAGGNGDAGHHAETRSFENHPSSTAEPPTAASPTRVPMRTRRLRADAEAMNVAFRNFPSIKVEPLRGDPPEAYRVQYTIDSLEPGPDGNPQPRREHTIEIQLTSEYPRLSPKCKILTPIFHPNFDAASICVGDHWTAGERLIDLVVRIGEMIAFQAYNIQSPLDGAAAMWADLHRSQLPTDTRNLRPEDME
jgi:ubiquitin-protein ligase